MHIPPQPGAMAEGLIHAIFKTDMKISPGKISKEEPSLIVGRDRMLKIAQRKITCGNLSEFKDLQNSLANSILDVANKLEGASPKNNGEKAVIKKIYRAAMYRIKQDPAKKQALIKDLKIYALQLLQATKDNKGKFISQRKSGD